MVKILQQNVPTCPICSAMMHKRLYQDHLYFICNDCKSIWKVLEKGQAEIELVVSNNLNDIWEVSE